MTAPTALPPPPPPPPPPDPPTAPLRPSTGPGGPGLLDRWSDPNLMLGAAAVMAVVGLLPTALKAPITLPLVLLLPGHALLAALDRPDRDLSVGPRLALRAIVSMTMVLLSVAAVGWLLGVDRFSAVGAIWAVTSLAAMASWNRDVPTREETTKPRWTQSGVLLLLTALVATLVVAAALAVLPRPRTTPYSRISLAGTTLASGSPIVVRSGTTAEVEVQVKNGTGREVTYGVIPAIDGGRLWKARRVRLAPGEQWTGTVKGKIPKDGCLLRLTIALSADSKSAGVAPLVTYIRNEAGDGCR